MVPQNITISSLRNTKLISLLPFLTITILPSSHIAWCWVAAGSYISNVDPMFSGIFRSQLHSLLTGPFWARDLTARHLDFLICRNGRIIGFLL